MMLSLITLLLGVGGIFTWRVMADESTYQKAVDYYEENDLFEYETIRLTLSQASHERFDEYLMTQALALVKAYQENSILFEEARDQLARIQSFAEQKAWFTPLQEQVAALKASRLAYQEATTYARNQQWEAAKEAYARVIESDENYLEAQQGLENVARWELESYLIQAITQYETKDYESALATIEKGLTLSPGHQEFLALQADVEQAMIADEAPQNKWSSFKDRLTESIESGLHSLGEGIQSSLQDAKDWIQEWWPFKKDE